MKIFGNKKSKEQEDSERKLEEEEKARKYEAYRQERKEQDRKDMVIYEGRALIVLDDSQVDDEFLWEYVENKLLEGYRFERNPTAVTEYMFLVRLEGLQ